MSHTLAQPLSEKRQKFSLLHRIMLRDAAPFVLRHALSRGILHMIQVSIGFLFMLAVMYVPPDIPHPDADVSFSRTFQVSFIFSIVIGQGVGEMLYGRYTSAARAAMHA
jgi:copper transporter 1